MKYLLSPDQDRNMQTYSLHYKTFFDDALDFIQSTLTLLGPCKRVKNILGIIMGTATQYNWFFFYGGMTIMMKGCLFYLFLFKRIFTFQTIQLYIYIYIKRELK